MDLLIVLHEITKDYRKLRALDKVSLALGSGIIGMPASPSLWERSIMAGGNPRRGRVTPPP